MPTLLGQFSFWFIIISCFLLLIACSAAVVRTVIAEQFGEGKKSH